MIGNVDILKRIHLAKAVHLALVHSHTQKVSISAVTDTLRRFASDLFLIYLVTYVYCHRTYAFDEVNKRLLACQAQERGKRNKFALYH